MLCERPWSIVSCRAFFGASAAAMLSMGIAGERAWRSYGHQGLGHFHMGILDELGRMSASGMEAEGKYDIL